MKVFSKEEFYKADQYTLKHQKITSDELMERAAKQVVGWLKNQLQDRKPKIHIFCGVGNNGGDGLAIARLLVNEGYEVNVYVVNFSDKRTDDFLLNLDRLKENKLWPEFLNEHSDLPNLKKEELIIDAIFGIGLNRKSEAWVNKIIKHINDSSLYVISIDVPSGICLDAIVNNEDAIVHANTTITFQMPKLVFFLPETAVFAGYVQVVDIGLEPTVLNELPGEANVIDNLQIEQLYKRRKKFSHKGTYGHILVVGGSYGKIGSMVLATKAALRIGSGKVTALIPKCGYSILQSTVPEAMVISAETENYLSHTPISFLPESVCFGMGAGKAPETVDYLKQLLKEQNSSLLIDADGLNILSEHTSLLRYLPENTILTPHIGELKRLIGEWKDDFEKVKKAKAFSAKYKIVFVVKDAYTIIMHDGQLYINTTGNPGMATAGSGDVLSGIIAGLMAQNYTPLQAAILGVYLHGKAGDVAAHQFSEESLIASDIIENLGRALHFLKDKKQA